MFTDPTQAATYALAGNATLTLTSKATDARYTFKVQVPKQDTPTTVRFVKLLTGPQNTTDYTYLGMIKDGEFRMTAKSKMSDASTPVRAFRYFLDNVITAKRLPAQLEVRHEGSCGRCGRTLTVPESIDRGIGPECIKHI